MFKNLIVFRLTQKWDITAEALHQQLSRIQFAACASSEMQSQGWSSPRNNDQLVHSVNHQFLITLTTERKLLPAAVINEVTKERAAELEEIQGFAPGRVAMKALKESVTDELLPRAFTVKKNTNVWIDQINRWIGVDSSSPARADEVIKLLLKCCDKLPLEGLRVKLSPQAAMTSWLAGNEAPKGFTIDQDTKLTAITEDKATVKYTRHTLDPADIKHHIAAGKQCTELAMTWDDRISFVLTDNLTIKRVKALDILDEEKDKSTNEDERFDGDFMLMTAELAKMLDDIVFALGGELESAMLFLSIAEAESTQRDAERALGLTAELYKMRGLFREVLNELYDKTVQPEIARVKDRMKATDESALKAALEMAKLMPHGSSASQLLLVAAVEIMEPSRT